MKDVYPVNEKIRSPQVKVIDENNEMLGVLDTPKAIEIAKDRGYDLVAVSPKAQPPVCKLLDYGSFKYQKEKSLKKQKAQQKKGGLKEIRLSVRIGQHDLETRKKQAEKFLNKGDKLTITVILKGRERQHPELAKDLINNFINKIEQSIPVNTEQEPKKQGNKFFAIIYPSGENKETQESKLD